MIHEIMLKVATYNMVTARRVWNECSALLGCKEDVIGTGVGGYEANYK